MEITVIGLLLGLLLLALPIYIVCAFDLGLLRRLGVSLARMTAAVALLGAVIALLMRYDRLWLNIVAGVVLALLSSVAIVARSGLRQGRLLGAVAAATLASLIVLVPYVLLVVVSAPAPFSTRLLIPVVCLLAGSASGLTARALRAYYIGLEHHGELYYYLLGNGATHREAVRHFMRRGFQAALLPAMKRMSALLLTGAPTLMLALVMSGVGVWTAVILDILLAVAVIGCALATFWLSVLLSRRYAFDAYERLRPMKRGPQPADPPAED